MLSAQNISYKIGNSFLLKETSVRFSPGQFHVIMGANGAGKSTLLKLLAGDLKPSSGAIFLDDKKLSKYSKNNLASKRAVLSQHYHLAFPITVEEIVLMGRYPYFPTQPTANDLAICKEAVRLMDVAHLLHRDYTTLSGGEAQKVQMSRVLAQIWNNEAGERRILFLDEPVSHLDVKYQYQLLRVAKDFCERNTTVIAVLHDLNLAINFANRILLMKEGAIIHELENADKLTTEIIKETFDVASTILQSPGHSKPIVVF
ncbi:MAG: heme transporter ATP-binding protein [Flavisolibacter sp.]|nr:heme transporter ATP-binding protein [Flavisolibacter sp.]